MTGPVDHTADGAVQQPAGKQAIVERVCPQCESAAFEASDAYSKDEWSVGSCGNCGFVYLRNVPIYDRMIDEFAWEKTIVQETDRRFSERPVSAGVSHVFRRIRRPFRASEYKLFAGLFKPGPVLDVGCGDNQRIPDAFTPYGVELSRVLCERANDQMSPRGGHAVHAPAVEGVEEFEDKFFSGIILRSFLEHEWQPKLLLERAHRVLRDDGGIFIRVPNFGSFNRTVRGAQWCGFRYPDHVNYFTADSLRKMARDCGFDMRLLNPVKLSIDDNIKAVLTKRSPQNGAVS